MTKTEPKWLAEIREREQASRNFTFPAALDRAALLRHVDELRGALAFYADAYMPPDGSDVWYNGCDKGAKAEKALAHDPTTEKGN